MNRAEVLNPSGGVLRSDTWGDGRWRAARGTRDHMGVDHVVMPGQPIIAPAPGFVSRRSAPYAPSSGDWWHHSANVGLVIDTVGLVDHVKPPPVLFLWYVRPLPGIVGSTVAAGQVVAIAESVAGLYRRRYPDEEVAMLDHVHLELRWPGAEKIRLEPIVVPWA